MLLFLGTIGFTQYFHWNALIPVFAIAGAILIAKIIPYLQSRLRVNVFYLIFSSIVVFGMLSTSILITADATSAQFEAISFVLNHTKDTKDITILASPTYSWIFDKVFDKENVPLDYSHVLYYDVPTKNMLVVSDAHLIYDFNRGEKIRAIYENTTTIKQFEGSLKNISTETYPFGSFDFNYEGTDIQVRTNYDKADE